MYCIVRICFLLKIGDYVSLTYVITTQSMGQILDRFRKGINDSYTTSVDQALYYDVVRTGGLKALVK